MKRSAQWMFHVRHNARPVAVIEILLILNDLVSTDEMSIERLLAIGQERGYGIGTSAKSAQSVAENPLQVARDLGLVQLGRIALTSLGKQVVDLLQWKPKIVSEVLHFLFYSTWSPENPDQSCFSWSYAHVCDKLWEASPTRVDRNRLAAELADEARSRFNVQTVALSKDSIQGVFNWIAELTPPVLTKQQTDHKEVTVLTRRNFCPPETFALAVNYIHEQRKQSYQSNLLLDANGQAAICRVCLLELNCFDSVLEWACGQFDFIRHGTSGGWGHYLVLTRKPTITDFLQ